MLKALREGTKSGLLKYFLLLLMGLAVMSLVFIDMSGSFSGGVSVNSIAKVGDSEISTSQFMQRYQQSERQAGLRSELPQAMRVQLGLEVADQMVRQRVYLAEADDIGLLVSDTLAAKQIKGQLKTLIDNGFTEQEALAQTLRSTGLSEGQFVALMKQDISTKQLLQAVTLGSYSPKQMLDTAYKFQKQSRSADYVHLKTASFAKDVPTPTDEEIETFYEANISNYLTPEYREISYLIFDEEAVSSEITLTDEDIEDAYNNRIDEYTVAAHRVVDQAVFKTAEGAQDIVAKAFDNQDLNAALKSAKKDSYILLPDEKIAEDDPIVEIVDAAFDTPIGEIVGPIQTGLGWIVMKVKSEKEEYITPLEDIKEDLTKAHLKEVKEDRYYEIANDIDDMLASGASLQSVADEYAFEIYQTPLLTLKGKTESGKTAEIMQKDFASELLAKTFALQDDELPPLMETEDGKFIAFAATKTVPQKPKELSTVRKDVMNDWKLKKQRDLMMSKATSLSASLAADRTVKSAAKENKLAVTSIKSLTAEGAQKDEKHPDLVKRRLFSLKSVGETALVPLEDGIAILQMTDISFPEKTGSDEEIAQIKASIRDQIRQDLIAQYEVALRDKFDVKIKPDAIERLLQPADDAF
jgi:peptidyl-prolyl cis-trans isomerase D